MVAVGWLQRRQAPRAPPSLPLGGAGPFLLSSVIAAGRLMRLSERQLTEAIGIAMNSHIAMRQVRAGTLCQWKVCSAPNVAQNGIASASLAKPGFISPAPIFEGEMGFMNQVTGPFSVDTKQF